MRTTYYEQDDILNIELSKGEIVRDVSYGWNVNIGFTALDIAEITILDAQVKGYYLLEHVKPDHQG